MPLELTAVQHHNTKKQAIQPSLGTFMDWFSWLSKTSLDLTLVYDYGVVFACNELTAEDILHLDHDFLQSMGITVAKHRLEIIKLARSEARSKTDTVSGRVREAINRTKKRVVECAKKMMFQEKNTKLVVKYWRRGGQKENQRDEGTGEVFMLTHHSNEGHRGDKNLGYRSPRPRIMKSGPLERNNGQARVIRRGYSGPLDKVLRVASPSVWLPEKSGWHGSKKSPVAPLTPSFCRSPRGLEGNDGIDSLWAKLFQDMKPT